MPKMKHPASDHKIDVSPAQVPMYESQGWRTVSAPRKKAATDTADNATTKE
jgi:hypothetical protein